MASSTVPAYMGYVGFIRFRPQEGSFSGEEMIVRASSADISLKQEITAPNVIDSRYDRTVYQLGPKEIEGSISFPAVYDKVGDKSIVHACYALAAKRTSEGVLEKSTIDVRYAPSGVYPQQSDFNYTGCYVNSFKFSVAQSDMVNITVDMLGTDRAEPGADQISDANYESSRFDPFQFNNASNNLSNYLENTRVITWNDARIELFPFTGNNAFEKITGEYVRSFEVNLNNNAERFYTLNGLLTPAAIAPTKRDVNGQIVLMGRHIDLAVAARENQLWANTQSKIRFGYVADGVSPSGQSLTPDFKVELPNVVFKIEEMQLVNEVFETTVNWISLPAAGTSQSTDLDDPICPSTEPSWTFETFD